MAITKVITPNLIDLPNDQLVTGISTTYNITVINSGGNKYAVDGVQQPDITLIPGTIYIINQDDSTNNAHPLILSTSSGAAGVYSTGVTYSLNGANVSYASYTSGFAAATQRRLTINLSSPPALSYICYYHPGMGSNVLTTPGAANTDGVVLAKGPTSGTASIDYLVVAGGGGSAGGYQSGGGGGGGLRTSYPGGSGGGGASETALQLSSGVNYTVTIGAGGAAGIAISAVQGSSNKGGNGGDSSISGSNITTLTSDGGGGSASYWNSPIPNNIGNSGGSGGGAGPFSGSIGSNTRAAGTPNQGYAGGGAVGYADPYMGAGGGGAGGVGTDASGGTLIGNGGVGLQVDIDGNNNYYAGGGGGAGWSPSYSPGTGGNGGGGNGGSVVGAGANPGPAPTAGTSNTGGGGGGQTQTTTVGTSGGSGVVILRYPNNLTATYTAGTGGAADSEVTVGTDKYIKITAGIGTIAFSGIPTTGGRPTTNLSIGEFRYNTTDKKVEYYDGAGWFTLDTTEANPQ